MLLKKNKDLLILITSCGKNNKKQDFQRELFKNSSLNYFFLIGGSTQSYINRDVLYLNAPDTYEMLHLKIVEAIKFFKAKHNILKIDDDTLVDINKLKRFNFSFDYGGYIANSGKGDYDYHCEKIIDKRYSSIIKSELKYKFAYGGGYYLSKKAQKIFLKNYSNSEEYYNHLKFLKGREDRLIGQTLFPYFNKLDVQNSGYRFLINKQKEHSFSAFNDSVFHPFEEKDIHSYKNSNFLKFIYYKNLLNSKKNE